MSTEASLSRPTRQFIVLVALLQGLLLYLADTGHEHGWWPFTELGGRVCWYTLVLAVPAVMLLSVRDIAERRFWQHVALVAAVFGALGAYAAWSATGDPGIRAGEVLGPFGAGASLALFVALPYFQARLAHGRWCAPYADLFEHAWQNGITLALTGLFVGIAWGVLTLWGELFKLIGIHFFADLFDERPFVYLATGTMVGLGILIGRTQHRAVQVARQILLAIGKGLLPLVAIVALLFVASLPFTGLEALWKTRHAAAILLWLVVLMIAFVNAVYQDGPDAAPYPRPLRLLVEAALAVLPVFAGLALYAIVLRQRQYGWTGERFNAFLVALVLAAYALGYAWSVLRRQTWRPAFGRINVALSLGVVALVAAMNTPLLDPHRIAVASQLARWRAPDAKPRREDVVYLRFDAGRRGWQALKDLRAEPAVAGNEALAQRIDETLAQKSRWGQRDSAEPPLDVSLDLARRNVKPAKGTAPPDDAWLQALVDERKAAAPPSNCIAGPDECIALAADLDADGTAERILCSFANDFATYCSLWTLADGRWRNAGTAKWDTYGSRRHPVQDAIREGRIELKPRRWADLAAGGYSSSIEEH
ncbi:MAG TPA: DUF4153 domain-containing protein [Tahibacter sp.]|nr:DUF4153 domain-containing protein [Tahibacter sp.]